MHFSDMDATDWRDAGSMVPTDAGSVFVLDSGADHGSGELPPLLIIHGFPTCSFDFRHVLDALGHDRRVVLFDQLGFGWSDKPDRRYGIDLHASTAEAVLDTLGIDHIDLLTHDMGDTVGGELLARTLEGTSTLRVRRRALTNGSIYLDLAQLTPGQLLLMELPDAPSDLVSGDGFRAGVASTFSPSAPAEPDELDQQWILASYLSGHALLPRTIRYLEDRRVAETRYTGAIESHPSPLGVVWGVDDPVAVIAMTDRLAAARPGTPIVRLEGVGHYPMIEAPSRFAEAVIAFLSA